jgi:hypothetical protein
MSEVVEHFGTEIAARISDLSENVGDSLIDHLSPIFDLDNSFEELGIALKAARQIAGSK